MSCLTLQVTIFCSQFCVIWSISEELCVTSTNHLHRLASGVVHFQSDGEQKTELNVIWLVQFQLGCCFLEFVNNFFLRGKNACASCDMNDDKKKTRTACETVGSHVFRVCNAQTLLQTQLVRIRIAVCIPCRLILTRSNARYGLKWEIERWFIQIDTKTQKNMHLQQLRELNKNWDLPFHVNTPFYNLHCERIRYFCAFGFGCFFLLASNWPSM